MSHEIERRIHMILYKCDKCGKLMKQQEDIYRITINLHHSLTKNVYDICEECACDFKKDFKSGKIFVE